MSAAQAEEFAARDRAPPVEVLPQNWPAVCVFVDCATQWRYGERGATGLEYASVVAVMRLHGIKDKRDTFNRIRVLESTVLEEFAKRS
jgi:hypothetical protein